MEPIFFIKLCGDPGQVIRLLGPSCVRARSRRAGFTRFELAAVLAGVALLSAAALPMLAGTRSRSDRIVCLNNLRQIVQAFSAWASDHGDMKPWILDATEGGYRNPVGSSVQVPGWGTFPVALRANSWFQFLCINRELSTPQVLACPSDVDRNVATSWGKGPGGLQHLTRMNTAVSYAINLHTPSTSPRSVLLADRNLEANSWNTSCSYGFTTTRGIAVYSGPTVGWGTSNPSLHGDSGNVALNDGSVEQLTGPGLRQVLWVGERNSNAGLHLIFP